VDDSNDDTREDTEYDYANVVHNNNNNYDDEDISDYDHDDAD
jgi:hypothetical protein